MTGRSLCSAISAVISEESSPPLSIEPSGTSLTICRRVAALSSSSRRSRSSSQLAPGRRGGPPSSPYADQYARTATSPSPSHTATEAGSSLRTPANSERGPGT